MSTYTDTYVFEHGCWQCVQAQITPVTEGNHPADDTIVSGWIKGVRQPRTLVSGARSGQWP